MDRKAPTLSENGLLTLGSAIRTLHCIHTAKVTKREANDGAKISTTVGWDNAPLATPLGVILFLAGSGGDELTGMGL